MVRRPWGTTETPYEAIGGDATVRAIADRFYEVIDESAPTLRAMLPRDLSVSSQKLYEFLSGWMGGPPLYWDKYGHPRLRMRHMPFAIDAEAAAEWSRSMATAIADTKMPADAATYLTEQLGNAAVSLINQ